MSITGIGSHYTYLYNAQTHKLSTKNGNEDAFVKYFNDELSEEDYGELNGYNAKMKGDIISMIRLFNSGVQGAKVFESDNNLYEISAEIVNAEEAKYSVNGVHSFQSYSAMPYTKAEAAEFSNLFSPYKTHDSKGYNRSDNSINIAVGDVFDLGNGKKVVVENNKMKGIGFSSNNIDIYRFNVFLTGLDSLMRVADQIGFSSLIDEESTPMILDFLQKRGVDITREFIVNGTKLEVVNGKIAEVGNTHVVPNSIFQKALQRYEKWMYQPLATRSPYLDDLVIKEE